MNSKKYMISDSEIGMFLFLLPLSSFVLFFGRQLLHLSLEINSYFNFILTLMMYRIVEKKFPIVFVLNMTILVGASLFYSLYYSIGVNVCLSYLTSINNVVLGLFVFSNVDFSAVNMRKLRSWLVWFSVLFIFFYELSHPFARDRSFTNEYYGNSREYKEGFVISHVGCYYMAITGFFLFIMKKRILAILLWIYVLTLGPRIGQIYMLVGLAILIGINRRKIYSYLKKYSYFWVVGTLVTLIVVSVFVFNKYGYEQINVYTSGRAKIWMNALIEINTWDFKTFLIGKGPKQSLLFNDGASNIHVWMHNDYLDVLFNLGFFGLIIYLGSISKFILKSKSIYFGLIFVLAAFFNGFFFYDPVYLILLVCLFEFYKKK